MKYCVTAILYLIFVGLSNGDNNEDLEDSDEDDDYDDDNATSDEIEPKCENITVTNKPKWYKLRATRPGAKWILPFFLSLGNRNGKVVLALADMNFDVNSDKEDANKKIIITFIYNMVSLQFDSGEAEYSGILPKLFKAGEMTGFWVKVSKKKSKTVVGVYSSTEGPSNALIYVDLEGKKDLMADKFTFMNYGNTDVKVQYNCTSKLGQLCSQDKDCKTRNARCSGAVGKEPGRVVGKGGICTCEEEFSEEKDKCIDISINIGEECTRNKQCWHYDGKCRIQKDKLNDYDDKIRVCECDKDMKLRDGKCTLPKDRVRNTLDVGKLNRELSWTEKNPGRKIPTKKKANREAVPYPRKLGALMPHCAMGETLDKGSENPEWPIWWGRMGFVVSGFYRPLKIGWSEELPGSPRLEVTFIGSGVNNLMSVEFGDKDILFKEAGEVWLFNGTWRGAELMRNYWGVTPNPQKQPKLNENAIGFNVRWFYIEYQCQGDMCNLIVSQGTEGHEGNMTFHHTPIYQHQQLLDSPGIMSYSLVNVGEVKLEVATECLGLKGNKCVHSAQCLPLRKGDCIAACSNPQLECLKESEMPKMDQLVPGSGIATSCQCNCDKEL